MSSEECGCRDKSVCGEGRPWAWRGQGGWGEESVVTDW